jgi:hypothetical protein
LLMNRAARWESRRSAVTELSLLRTTLLRRATRTHAARKEQKCPRPRPRRAWKAPRQRRTGVRDFSDRRIDSALWAPDTPVRQKVAGFPHFGIEQLPQGSSDSSTRLFLDE